MSYKILVAEDDPNILKLIQTILKKEGYEVESCTNGRDAVEKVKRERFDCIVCDQTMPYVTGSELATFIKGYEKTKSVPVIMLSAENNPTAFAALIEQNIISSFFPKPIQHKQLISLISLLLKNSEKSL